MSERKGLSQILYLIIAASVLMMVALSLIFMFNSSVGGATGDAAACRNTASAQCQVTPADYISAPSSCTQDDQVIEGAGSFVVSSDSALPSDSDVSTPAVECSQVE